MSLSQLSLLALAFLVIGCGDCAAPTPAPTTVPAPPAVEVTVSEPDPPPSLPSSPESSESSAESAPPADAVPDVEALRDQLEAIGDVIEQAAEETEAAGGDHCARAYAGFVALMDAFRSRLPAGQTPPLPNLNQEGFLTACRELPEDAQRCMVVGYATAHQEECQAVQETIGPEERDRLRRILMGEEPPAASPGASPEATPEPTPEPAPELAEPPPVTPPTSEASEAPGSQSETATPVPPADQAN